MSNEIKPKNTLNTWANTNNANAKNGWDPNKLVIPGYDNPTPRTAEPKDSVEVRKAENQHTKDESNIQWLRRKMGF